MKSKSRVQNICVHCATGLSIVCIILLHYVRYSLQDVCDILTVGGVSQLKCIHTTEAQISCRRTSAVNSQLYQPTATMQLTHLEAAVILGESTLHCH